MMLPPGSALDDSRRALVMARDSHLRRYLLEALSRVGYPSDSCGQELGALLEHGKVDRHAFIVMDEQAGDPKRMDVIRGLRESGAKIPVILLRGGPDEHSSAAGFGLGPLEFLSKPFTLRSLAGVIAKACGRETHGSRVRKAGPRRKDEGREGERSRSRGSVS